MKTLKIMRDEAFGHALAVGSLVIGVTLLLSIVTPVQPSRSIDLMPWFISILVGGFYLIGSGAALVGLQWRGDDVGRGWDYQKLGFWLLASAEILYATVVCTQHPGSVISYAPTGLFGVAGFARVASLIARERHVRTASKEAKTDG